MKTDVSKIVKEAEKAAQNWVADNKGQIGDIVRKKLDDQVSQVVAKLLGFDCRWDTWDVDHCNGRMGESAAGDWLRAKAGESVKQWLTDQAGNLPDLPPSAAKRLREEYFRTYERELGRTLREMAERNAAADAIKIAEDITKGGAE